MSDQHADEAPSTTEGDKQPAGSGDDSGGGVRRALRAVGPGIVTGAADDDPSGIATYAQSGAMYGTGLLWTVPLTLPLMIVVQEACERMTLATGDSFGALIRRRFQRGARTWIAVLLAALLVANSVNAAADLVAIGEGMSLLHAGPAPLWSLIAGVVIGFVVVRGSFAWISRVFKWLCLVLFAYVGVVVVASVDWADVLSGLLGRGFEWEPQYLGLVVAVLGTTISPYMFFWQTEEREEMLRSDARSHRTEKTGRAKPKTLDDRSPAEARRALWLGRFDVVIGMLFSVAIMFAIVVSSAAALGVHHQKVDSAEAAAKALQPIAGDFAFALFAIGFIGSGMLAVPVLAASGAAGFAALLGRPWSLDRKPHQARTFYALLLVGLTTAVVLSIIGVDPIGLLVLSATINGIAAGPFLIVLMLITGNRKLMGEHRNGWAARILGWTTAVIMCGAGAFGIVSLALGH
ncbi:Nramp family divalent metal transporter [Microbacterium sp. ZW T5_56]|uniref:Nramp family divalent metal transporter n=1 Tax=Microbacterium sp. ZW T5_56 TaxID=3378081 RepID=UPI0038520C80